MQSRAWETREKLGIDNRNSVTKFTPRWQRKMNLNSQSAPSPLGVIRATGADVDSFLQGQLTQDLRKLTAQTPLLAGYCSPKGRLLAVITLVRESDTVLLHLHRSVLDATLKRLRMFVLRSKVTLETLAATAVDDDNAWRLQQIERGQPVIYAQTADQFVPQMVNLDQLGGISFDKGCYTGQEIVARLHYLGQLKRRMFRCALKQVISIEPGTAIYAAGEAQAVGTVVDAARQPGDGMALSVVLQLGYAQSEELRLGGMDGAALSIPQAYY